MRCLSGVGEGETREAPFKTRIVAALSAAQSLWILASDLLLSSLINPQRWPWLSAEKGLLFVAATTLMLYGVWPGNAIRLDAGAVQASGDAAAFGRLWMKKLHTVFANAGIEEGHSHRFLDTFAVELFKRGVPIERVSVLLGHSNIRVTQKHYNPWVNRDRLNSKMTCGGVGNRTR